jgi:hypothetical protein
LTAKLTARQKRSDGRRRLELPPDLLLQEGDTLVLSGTVEQVGAAEARLLHS